MTDPNDTESLAAYGRVKLTFCADGTLDYVIESENKTQLIQLRYTASDCMIESTQPSAPRTERTAYSFDDTGRLLLVRDGLASCFVRAPYI